MKPTKIIELVLNVIPYPDQIKNLEIEESECDAIRFDWRAKRFRVSSINATYRINVEEVGNSVLIGSDICILFNALLKTAIVRVMEKDL